MMATKTAKTKQAASYAAPKANTTRPAVPLPTPSPTTLPTTFLSTVAKRLRDNPENKTWFANIENEMGSLEGDARMANLEVLRYKARLLMKTTRTSVLYAKAVLAFPNAPAKAKKAAQNVLKWRDMLEKSEKTLEQQISKGSKTGKKNLKEVEQTLAKVANAKWGLMEAALNSSVGGDVVKSFKPAPTLVPSSQKCPDNYALDPNRGTPRQRRMIEYLTAKGNEFLAHMHATRPGLTINGLKVTKNLLNWSRQIVPMSVVKEYSSSSHATTLGSPENARCIGFAFDSFSSLPRQLTRMLHEMTHVATPNEGHNMTFYKVFRMFMRVASEELGWTLEATCRETCFGAIEDGYVASKACPMCVWQQPPGTCNVAARTCEPDPDKMDKMLQKYANNPKALAYLRAKPNKRDVGGD